MRFLRICLFLLLVMALCVTAEADVIVKKDGSTIKVFNIEVGQKYITFTKEASPDSELGRIEVDQCFAIKTDDGEMKTIEASSQSKEEKVVSPEQVIKDAVGNSDNKTIIKQFNTTYLNKGDKFKEDPKKLHSGLSLMVWGIEENSVLSDDNMTMMVEPIDPLKGTYVLVMVNKTKENMYVDLTRSFKINGMGNAIPFYDEKIYSTSHGSNTGAGVNLGAVAGALGVGGVVGNIANGVNVGGSTSNSVQVTQADQPVMVIPPGGKIHFPLEKTIKDNKVEELPEIFYYCGSYYDFVNSFVPSGIAWGNRKYIEDDASINSKKIQLHKNGLVEFTSENTPKRYQYIVSYSTDPSFSKVNRAKLSLYLRGIYGIKPGSKSIGFNFKLGMALAKTTPPFIWGYGTILKGE